MSVPNDTKVKFSGKERWRFSLFAIPQIHMTLSSSPISIRCYLLNFKAGDGKLTFMEPCHLLCSNVTGTNDRVQVRIKLFSPGHGDRTHASMTGFCQIMLNHIFAQLSSHQEIRPIWNHLHHLMQNADFGTAVNHFQLQIFFKLRWLNSVSSNKTTTT